MQEIPLEAWSGVGVAFAAFMVYLNKDRLKTQGKTAIHQEIARPQTEAELRQAVALEKLANDLSPVDERLREINTLLVRIFDRLPR